MRSDRSGRADLQRRTPDGGLNARADCRGRAPASCGGACSRALVGGQLHVANYRFLWRTNIIEEIRSKATAGGQFPSVWTAFFNSLALALTQTAIILTVASLAGYYISRFAFRGREAFLQGLLVLHAFPAMTLIIPIFLILYWIGLLDTIPGVILVLADHRASLLRVRDEGLFRCRALGHRDERDDRRRDAPPGIPSGRAAAGARGLDRGRGVRLHPRVGGVHLRPDLPDREHELGDEPVPVLGLGRIMGVDYGIVAAVSVFYVCRASSSTSSARNI